MKKNDFYDISKSLNNQTIEPERIDDFFAWLDSGLENSDSEEYFENLAKKDLSKQVMDIFNS